MAIKNKIIVFFFLSVLLISLLPIINYNIDSKQLTAARLFNMDVIESYSNYLILKMFNRSTNINKVIVGKGGFFFLGNENNQVTMKTQNLFNNSKDSLNIWVEDLKAIQNKFELFGIEFIIVVVPNKQSFYSNKLPNWVVVSEESITKKLIKLARQNDVNILNLNDSLQKSEFSSNNFLYYKKDSHWNELGASIGYLATIDFLNKTYKKNYKKVNFSYQVSAARRSDLLSLLKLQEFNFIPDDIKHYILKTSNNICYAKIFHKNVEPCAYIENKELGIHNGPYFVENKNSVNKQKLLFMSDSFSTATSRLYNQTFQEIWSFHYNKHINNDLKTFINKHKPNVVIYQVVERNLYNNYFIKH